MRKKHIRNNILFVRYGSLNATKHDFFLNNKNEGTYHSPPANKGIYAFVYPYIEKFLLSNDKYSGIKSENPKLTYPRDKNGSKFYVTADIFSDTKDSSDKIGHFNKKGFDDQQLECFSKILNNKGQLHKDYNWSQIKEKQYVLTKRIQPKVFKYEGDIWHHLEDFLDSKGSIIERKGSWVKTPFLDYKKALQKSLGKVNKTLSNSIGLCYSRDFLEVFIEKIN